MILEVDHLVKDFGSLRAVNEVSFGIEEGDLVALIGPNGAGKTTVFNTITGFLWPDRGKVAFRGEIISRMPPHQISRRGIGLAFQITKIFPRLTLFQNVQVALFVSRGKGANLFSLAPRVFREEAREILSLIGLGELADLPAGALSQADKKRLEFAIAMAGRPKFLLLDEPTSGQSAEESALTVDLIHRINQERGLTILFVEHKMPVVFGIARRILVMHQGFLIADGQPEVVRRDEKVQKAYLGENV